MALFSLFKKKHKMAIKPIPNRTIDELKAVVNILFIDDTTVSKAKQLKNCEGWRNVSKIKDVESLTQQQIRDAHIIFVDVQGVGKIMEFENEGLDLIVALKQKYPEKKVVMYSAESQGKIDAFHHASDVVDGRLRKGADLYEFETTAERLAMEAFCLDNCAKHIKNVLKRDLNVDLSELEIKAIIQKINNEGLYNDSQKMANLFSVSNIGSVASIIQLLLMPFTI